MPDRLLKSTMLGALMLVLAAPAALAQELPDLTITTTGPENSLVGERAEYHVAISNIGTAPAVFPAGSTYCVDEAALKGVIRRPGWQMSLHCDSVFPGMNLAVIGTFPDRGHSVNLLVLNSEFAIGAGESGIPRTETYILPSGRGRITNCVTVDPDNVVVESDETNNRSCVTTRVSRR
jgi:hypothetical protein